MSLEKKIRYFKLLKKGFSKFQMKNGAEVKSKVSYFSTFDVNAMEINFRPITFKICTKPLIYWAITRLLAQVFSMLGL